MKSMKGIIYRWIYLHLGLTREGMSELVGDYKRELLLEEVYQVYDRIDD